MDIFWNYTLQLIKSSFVRQKVILHGEQSVKEA